MIKRSWMISKKKRWLSNKYRFTTSRPTTLKINFLKEIRSKIKNNDIDFIVTNINSRLVYWILKKRICEIDNFNAGNCGISEKF